jgi:hypothetical protein
VIGIKDSNGFEEHLCFLDLHGVTVQWLKKDAERTRKHDLVLACPSLALVAFALLDNVLVGVALCTGFVTTLGWSAPDGDGVDVTL